MIQQPPVRHRKCSFLWNWLSKPPMCWFLTFICHFQRPFVLGVKTCNSYLYPLETTFRWMRWRSDEFALASAGLSSTHTRLMDYRECWWLSPNPYQYFIPCQIFRWVTLLLQHASSGMLPTNPQSISSNPPRAGTFMRGHWADGRVAFFPFRACALIDTVRRIVIFGYWILARSRWTSGIKVKASLIWVAEVAIIFIDLYWWGKEKILVQVHPRYKLFCDAPGLLNLQSKGHRAKKGFQPS